MYEIYCDTRLGGTKKWSLGLPKGVDMRVPDEVLLSVCFLCTKNVKGEYAAVGTGFFVNVKSENYPDNRFIHLVTAKHLIEKSQELGLEDLHARTNKKPSGVDYIKIPNSSWLFHEDPNVDVAVIPHQFSQPSHSFFPVGEMSLEKIGRSGLGGKVVVHQLSQLMQCILCEATGYLLIAPVTL